MKKTSIFVAVVLFAAACGDSTTTGKRIVLGTVVRSDLNADRTFTTGLGWEVTLTQALVSTGPFSYFDGDPAFTLKKSSWVHRFVAALSPVGTAHAHPGHYVAGRALGQMTQPYSLDLLDPTPAVFPDGDGITGAFRSGTFSFAPPQAGPAASALGSSSVMLAGRAHKADKTVHFRFAVNLSEIAQRTNKESAVHGCALSGGDVDGTGTIEVVIKPRTWMNLVDFSASPPGTAEAPTTFASDDIERIAVDLGLAQLSAYAFTFTPAGEKNP